MRFAHLGPRVARLWRAVLIALTQVLGASAACAITPDDPGAGDLRFTISSAGATRPISPYIYGVNGAVARARHDV